MVPEFFSWWLQYFLDQAVRPRSSNISWARWLVLQEISLSIKRDFWIHISLYCERISAGFKKWQNIKTLCTSCKYAVQFDKCPDFLQIEIYYYKKGKISGCMYKFQISWNGTGFKKWQNIKTLCTSCKYAVQFDKCPDFLQIEIYYYKKGKISGCMYKFQISWSLDF